MAIKIEKNNRGFLCGEFEDRYGKKCSIQESSLAGEPAIWLGCNEGDHVRDEVGKEVCLARMHLTQDMVNDLIPLLDHFLYEGKLPPVEEKYEAWTNIRIEIAEGKIEIRELCLGVFDNRDEAIHALRIYARRAFGDKAAWDGYQIVISRIPEMVGYNGGFLVKHGESKR